MKKTSPKNLAEKFFFLFAVFSPLIVRLLYPGIYSYDVSMFNSWSALANPFRKIYLTCGNCDYPIVGLFLSAGIIKLLGSSITKYLLTCALIDGTNTLLVYFILRKLDIPVAMFWSGLIGLLPSTWAGGFFWGQIDNFGQSILYVTLILYIQIIKNPKLHPWYLHTLMGVSLSIAFLTKQLLIFSIVTIGLSYVVYLLKIYSFNSFLRCLGVFCLGFLFPLFLFELWIYTPDEYLFFAQKAFKTGSNYMDTISENGFNLWSLFFSSQNTSSTLPLFADITPKQMGLVSFCIFYFAIFLKFLRSQFNLSRVFLTIALANLAMNIFLTGTHERYLYHCYPFLIIALIIERNQPKELESETNYLIPYVVFSGFCYGVFVFGSLIKSWIESFFYQSLIINRLCALIHIILLIKLSTLYFGRNKPLKTTQSLVV